jgi:hypothetical protein
MLDKAILSVIFHNRVKTARLIEQTGKNRGAARFAPPPGMACRFHPWRLFPQPVHLPALDFPASVLYGPSHQENADVAIHVVPALAGNAFRHPVQISLAPFPDGKHVPANGWKCPNSVSEILTRMRYTFPGPARGTGDTDDVR